jgi:sporulation protein YlmC with PRC-barrel domain
MAAASQGCAALALPAIGTAAVSAGAGGVVKAGTEYTLGGAATRTFTLSLADLHAVTLDTLRRLEIDVVEEEASADRVTISGEAVGRRVELRLDRITPVLTQLRLVVRRDAFRKDRATATEIIAQTEHAVAALAASTGAALPGAAVSEGTVDVRRLLGVVIRDARGTEVGAIRDIRVNRHSGRVTAVVVAVAPSLGAREAYKILPWNTLRFGWERAPLVGVYGGTLRDPPGYRAGQTPSETASPPTRETSESP